MPRLNRSLAPAIAAFVMLSGCRRGYVASEGEPSVAPRTATDGSAFEALSLQVGGHARTYLLRVPPAARARGPMPLVVSLHGGGGHAQRADEQSGWGAVAEREGFAIVYPEGTGRSWNDGRDDTPSAAVRENVDDVGFLAALIEDIAARAPIDRKRVYMGGISNGAFMSARFACERADLVAAIGLVSATIGPDVLARCKPSRRVSVIAFSGSADPIVPFEGGTVRVGPLVRGKAASFADSIRLWTTVNGCTTAPARRDLPDGDPDDGSTVHLDAYACAEGAAVDAYTIVGGGHTWPGGKQYLPRKLVGPVNRDIDATRAMWSFFVAHPGG